MSGFDLSTTIQLSIIHYPSNRGSQNLGRLNRRLSEVLSLNFSQSVGL